MINQERSKRINTFMASPLGTSMVIDNLYDYTMIYRRATMAGLKITRQKLKHKFGKYKVTLCGK